MREAQSGKSDDRSHAQGALPEESVLKELIGTLASGTREPPKATNSHQSGRATIASSRATAVRRPKTRNLKPNAERPRIPRRFTQNPATTAPNGFTPISLA